MKKGMAIVLALMSFVSLAVRAQNNLPATQRLKVAVILPDLETDDSVLQSVAKAIQDTVSLNLILSARYSVERIDFLAPAKDFAKARTYFVDKDYDGAIWGWLARSESGIKIRLTAWKRGEAVPGIEEATDGVAVLGIFDVVDHMTLAVLERFAGTRIAMGTLRFLPSGDPLPYSVSINGEPVGEGIQVLRVPATTLQIHISALINGQEYPQTDLQVTVLEDQEQEVAFHLESPKEQPAPLAERQPAPAVAQAALSTQLTDDERYRLMKLLDQRAYRDNQKIKEIELMSERLPVEQRKYFYDKYTLSWAILPAFGNTFYGLGSWLQGDYRGGLLCTGCMLGGAILFVGAGGNSSSGSGQLTAPKAIGGVAMVVGLISGWVFPFLFQGDNNSKLKTALHYFP